VSSTLEDLIAVRTQQQLFAQLLAVFKANGFPVESWQTFGTERTRLMAFSSALIDALTQYVPDVAAGGLPRLAANRGLSGWLDLTAQYIFQISRILAVRTEGIIRLRPTTGTGPFTVLAGRAIAVFGDSGNRYINVEGFTIPLSNSVDVLFRAEFAGAKYADISNDPFITLATPIPGVTLSNPASLFTGINHIGSGAGTISLAGSTPSSAPHQVTITIEVSGDIGLMQWSYSMDGSPAVNNGTNPFLSIPGTGIVITMVNGTPAPSFIRDETYTFGTPGSWVTLQGTDEESDADLATDCENRWPTLSPIATVGLYEFLARRTPIYGTQVTQVIVVPDEVINDRVNIVVAGPAGPLSSASIIAIQNFLRARRPGTVIPVVVSPTVFGILLSGVVTVQIGSLTSAQQSIDLSLTQYIQSVGINGIIRIAEIIDRIMEVDGVIDVTGVTINGSSSNVALGNSTTFLFPVLQPLALSYVGST